MRLKDALREALDLVDAEPGLMTMQKTRASANAAAKAIDKFLADAKLVLLTKDPDYIRIVTTIERLSHKKPDGPERVKAACAKAGLRKLPTGANAAAKIAALAMEKGKGKALVEQLAKDPATLLREELIAVAAHSPTDVRAALAKLLTDKKADQYADAAGFEVVRDTVKTGKKKGASRFNQNATIDNAMRFLEPFIESMADVHSG